MVSRSKRATMVPVSRFRHSDVVDNAIIYRPRNQTHQAASDNFTYMLRADNSQPAMASLVIDTHSAVTISPVVASHGPSRSPDSANTPEYDHPTPPPIVANKGPTDTKMPELSQAHLIVIIIVCVVTGLSIFFFIAVKCYKSKHKHIDDENEEDGYSTNSQDSSQGAVPYGGSDSDVYTSSSNHLDPQRDDHIKVNGNDHHYVHSRSIPTINVTSGTPDAARDPVHPRSRGSRSSLPGSDPNIRHRHYGEDSSTLGSKLSSSTETSKTVPMCKVTPLGDSTGASTGPPSTHGMDSGDEKTEFNWDQVDPELLDHCRRTNPVLHKNKYWV